MTQTKQDSSHKPDILLLHGLRGAPIGLAKIKSNLETLGFIVHTPAVPPFADAGSMSEYTIGSYADFIKQWIENHNLKNPILIGHSMGSMVVAAVATMHPDAIDERITLLSPISERAAAPFRLVSPLASFLPSRTVDYVTSKFLFTGHGKAEFRQVMQVTHECGDHNRNVAPKDLAKATKFSVSYGVGDIFQLGKVATHQKIYIIAGAKDRLVSQKATRRLATDLNAKLTLIEGTGHLHNYEKPQETAALIAEFIKSS